MSSPTALVARSGSMEAVLISRTRNHWGAPEASLVYNSVVAQQVDLWLADTLGNFMLLNTTSPRGAKTTVNEVRVLGTCGWQIRLETNKGNHNGSKAL